VVGPMLGLGLSGDVSRWAALFVEFDYTHHVYAPTRTWRPEHESSDAAPSSWRDGVFELRAGFQIVARKR